MRKILMLGSFALSLAALPALAKEPPTVGGGHMQHCPSAVEGAKTEVKETKDAVEITVVATTPAKTVEIRKRAKHVVDAAKSDPATVAHEGNGHGGGGLGRCEVVLKDTTVTSEDVDGGSHLTVKPNRPVDFEWLKKETRDRQAANKGGKGAAAKPKAVKAEKVEQ